MSQCGRLRAMPLAATSNGTPLSLGDKLTIAAIAVALLAIIVGVWAVRRWGVRRRRVFYALTSSPLIPALSALPSDDLKVTFKDLEVKDPHIVLIAIENIGPLDVTSNDFDDNRPITFDLNCKFFGLVESTHPNFTSVPSIGSNTLIKIRPLLLRRGEVLSVAAIVSGAPNLQADLPLQNTDLLDKREIDAEAATSLFLAVARIIAPVVPGAGLATAAIDALSSRRSRDL